MKTIELNGNTIRYEAKDGGAGKPWVTLSHSLCCDLTMWDELAVALEPSFSVLRYDTRGHGGSSVPPGAYSFEQLTSDALGLLDALHIARTHFVGLSMGGMIAQHLALAAPQRMAKLVIANSSSRIPPEAGPLWDERIAIVRAQGCAGVVDGTLGRWFTPGFRDAHPEVMARIGALIAGTPADGYAGCAAAIRGLDITAKIGAISAPTLVIVGADDPGTPLSMAREIHENAPGSKLAILPQAAHLANLEQPAAFTQALREFLRAN